MRKVDYIRAGLESVIAHGGQGKIKFARLLSQRAGDFETNLHFVDFAILPPGASVGRHTHEVSEELYIIIGGSGRMTVNSEQFNVETGDIVLNPVGGTHSLVNTGTAELRMIVVEVGISTRLEEH